MHGIKIYSVRKNIKFIILIFVLVVFTGGAFIVYRSIWRKQIVVFQHAGDAQKTFLAIKACIKTCEAKASVCQNSGKEPINQNVQSDSSNQITRNSYKNLVECNTFDLDKCKEQCKYIAVVSRQHNSGASTPVSIGRTGTSVSSQSRVSSNTSEGIGNKNDDLTQTGPGYCSKKDCVAFCSDTFPNATGVCINNVKWTWNNNPNLVGCRCVKKFDQEQCNSYCKKRYGEQAKGVPIHLGRPIRSTDKIIVEATCRCINIGALPSVSLTPIVGTPIVGSWSGPSELTPTQNNDRIKNRKTGENIDNTTSLVPPEPKDIGSQPYYGSNNTSDNIKNRISVTPDHRSSSHLVKSSSQESTQVRHQAGNYNKGRDLHISVNESSINSNGVKVQSKGVYSNQPSMSSSFTSFNNEATPTPSEQSYVVQYDSPVLVDSEKSYGAHGASINDNHLPWWQYILKIFMSLFK